MREPIYLLISVIDYVNTAFVLIGWESFVGTVLRREHTEIVQ